MSGVVHAAIPTEYGGVVMRSRTEARWALFFDVLKIQWEYEKEGYDLDGLGSYLPDYWLPQVNMWAEVKPGPFSDLELAKANSLSRLTGFDCILLDGIPDARNYWAYEGIDHPEPTTDIIFSDDNYHLTEHRFFANTGMGSFEIERQDHQSNLSEACRIAKFARFGEGHDPRLLIPKRFLVGGQEMPLWYSR